MNNSPYIEAELKALNLERLIRYWQELKRRYSRNKMIDHIIFHHVIELATQAIAEHRRAINVFLLSSLKIDEKEERNTLALIVERLEANQGMLEELIAHSIVYMPTGDMIERFDNQIENLKIMIQ